MECGKGALRHLVSPSGLSSKEGSGETCRDVTGIVEQISGRLDKMGGRASG